MSKDLTCRIQQHLLVQGFTLYTGLSATCTRLMVPAALDNHSWAALIGKDSLPWVQQLKDDDVLKNHFITAVNMANTNKNISVLCHYKGNYLIIPPDVSEVRHAIERLIKAAELNVPVPPIENIRAIPDSILQAELKRRKKDADPEETPNLNSKQEVPVSSLPDTGTSGRQPRG
jgi:hypothetical protein